MTVIHSSLKFSTILLFLWVGVLFSGLFSETEILHNPSEQQAGNDESSVCHITADYISTDYTPFDSDYPDPDLYTRLSVRNLRIQGNPCSNHSPGIDFVADSNALPERYKTTNRYLRSVCSQAVKNRAFYIYSLNELLI